MKNKRPTQLEQSIDHIHSHLVGLAGNSKQVDYILEIIKAELQEAEKRGAEKERKDQIGFTKEELKGLLDNLRDSHALYEVRGSYGKQEENIKLQEKLQQQITLLDK